MKKLIKKIIIITIIFIIFFINCTNIILAQTNQTIKGIVFEDKNGNGIQDEGEQGLANVKVQVCDENGKEVSGVETITGENGEYIFNIKIEEGTKYRLKYKYNGLKYKLGKITKNNSSYKIDEKIKKLKIMYTVPKEKTELISKYTDIMSKYKIEKEQNNIQYEKNSAQSTTGEPMKYDDLIIASKAVLGELNNKGEKSIIIFYANNNVSNIKSIKESISKKLSDDNQYRIFIILSNDLTDENVKNAFTETSERVKILQENNTELENAISQYLSAVKEDGQNGFGYEIQSQRDKLTNKINSLTIQEKNILYGITDYNNLTQIQTELLNKIGIEISAITEKIDGNLQNVDITVGLTDITNRSEEIAKGEKIKGKIFFDDTKELVNFPIHVKLTKKEGEEYKEIAKGITQNGEYGFDCTESGEYQIEFIYGHKDEIAKEGINGQNYKVSTDIISPTKDEQSNRNNAFEDEGRRQVINSYFRNNEDGEGINNYKVELLKGNKEPGKLSEKTYQKAYTEWFFVSADDETTYYANMGLVKREEFKISITKNISAMKIVLSDGQVLRQEIRTQEKNPFYYPTNWQIDDEIMHGATIYIEYDITIRNESNIPCEITKIIDHLDYKNNSLIYNKDEKMITENATNSTYGWEIKEIENYPNKDKLLGIELDGGKKYLELTNQKLEANESKKYKIIGTKMMTATNDTDDLTYENSVEIISYKNAEGRVDERATPGNYNPKEKDKEPDEAKSEKVIITPPTGGRLNWYRFMLQK